ncbi:protein transport protein bet1 [Chytriomyces hyalinus]|nr:protein transport protein bet1 [Chytriomyces hyalinus]
MDDQAASLLESQNDESVNALHAKIRAIKGISIDLHDNVNDQNRFLEDMSHSFNQVGDGLKTSAKRMQTMLKTPHGQQTCTMAVLVVVLLLSVWALWAKWSK